jgi:hypothetical protein
MALPPVFSWMSFFFTVCHKKTLHKSENNEKYFHKNVFNPDRSTYMDPTPNHEEVSR